MSQIFQIDQKLDVKSEEDGLIISNVDLNVKAEGKYNFNVTFADNFGFSEEKSITLEAKE